MTRAVLMLVAAGIAVAFGAQSASPAPDVQHAEYRIVVSADEHRSNPSRVAGRLPAQAHIFLAPSAGVRRVQYFVDGKLRATRASAPFDLAGKTRSGTARAFLPDRMAHGAHTLRAVVHLNGRTRTVTARFSVHHLFISPIGDDNNPCSATAPCQSFQRAYFAASPGSVVEVAGGSYASQSIAGTRAAPPVVFRPAVGSAVTVGGLSITADQLEFQGVHLGGWTVETDSDSVSFRNVKHNWFTIMGSNVSVLGGEVVPDSFPLTADYDPVITEGRPGVPPRNVLIDGVWFHDWTTTDANKDAHVECLQVGAGENVTIRNSRFERCATHDIFVRSWGGINGGVHNLRNFLIENNVFAVTQRGFYSIQFHGDLNASGCTGNVIRYNTVMQEPTSSNCELSWIGNLGYKYGSACHGTYRFNVWFKDEVVAKKCSASDRGLRGDPGFVNAAAGDYHLRRGSRAINAGDPRVFPARDMEGKRRPVGRAPDAGAYEAAR